MDELELRRRLFADPKQALPNPSEHTERLQRELQQFDGELLKAMQVPVPQGLAERLLFQKKQPSYRRYAMAASIALLSLLSFWGLQQQRYSSNIAEHALAHIRHEVAAFQSNENLPLIEVNELLAELGGQFKAASGTIRYARFCDFEGTRSLHLVIATEDGLYTVFVLPKQHTLEGFADFSDQDFAGLTTRLAKADVVVVASHQQPLQPFMQKLVKEIQFANS